MLALGFMAYACIHVVLAHVCTASHASQLNIYTRLISTGWIRRGEGELGDGERPFQHKILRHRF